jgi:histidine triad (HIT) family protein
MSGTGCLFCRILTGEVPSEEVASDERTYAFRDINPQAPVHILVIPRRHIDHAGAIRPGDAADIEALFLMATTVAKQEGIFESGYRLVFNVGDHALNSVPHLHMHLIGGKQLGWPPG